MPFTTHETLKTRNHEKPKWVSVFRGLRFPGFVPVEFVRCVLALRDESISTDAGAARRAATRNPALNCRVRIVGPVRILMRLTSSRNVKNNSLPSGVAGLSGLRTQLCRCRAGPGRPVAAASRLNESRFSRRQTLDLRDSIEICRIERQLRDDRQSQDDQMHALTASSACWSTLPSVKNADRLRCPASASRCSSWKPEV